MNKEILFQSRISLFYPFIGEWTNKDITLLLGQNLLKYSHVTKPNI